MAIGYINKWENRRLRDYIAAWQETDLEDLESWEDMGLAIGGIGDTAINFTGYVDGVGASNNIDFIRISSYTNALTFGDLTYARYHNVSTCNGPLNRGVCAGGVDSSGETDVYHTSCEYIIMTSLGNGTSFCNLNDARCRTTGTSNAALNRGIFPAGSYNRFGGSRWQDIQYITITSSTNSVTFGNITAATEDITSLSNGRNNRGVTIGGIVGGGPSLTNVIEYITISTTGNAANFGDCTTSRAASLALSNSIYNRGVFAGGTEPYFTNNISYITITSMGNSIDFGDLIVYEGLYWGAGASDGIASNGLFIGGNKQVVPAQTDLVQHVAIDTTANSTDFGDLTIATDRSSACANA